MGVVTYTSWNTGSTFEQFEGALTAKIESVESRRLHVEGLDWTYRHATYDYVVEVGKVPTISQVRVMAGDFSQITSATLIIHHCVKQTKVTEINIQPE
jgi:hypothetical protein